VFGVYDERNKRKEYGAIKMVEELSEVIMKFLKDLSEATSVNIDVLVKDYTEKVEYLKRDPEQFPNDEIIDSYLRCRFRAKYLQRALPKPRTIIPIGMDQIKKSPSSGSLYSSLYVIDQTKKFRRISFSGDICKKLKDIQLYYPVKDVNLLDTRSDDLIADERSDFSNIIDNKIDPNKIIQLTEAKLLTLSDILTAEDTSLHTSILSRVDDKGYPIKTDWRAVKGNVQSIKSAWDEKDNSNNGTMVLTDDTIEISKKLFNKDGTPLRQNIRVWVSPLVVSGIPQYSEVISIGPLTQNNKTLEISMTGCCVIPTKIVQIGD
jgi:hypothetical protein